MKKTKNKSEIARALGVNRQTIASWINKGEVVCDDGGFFDIEGIAKLKGRVVRRSEVKRVKRVVKAEEVLALAENTGMSSREIGERFGVNGCVVDRIKANYRRDLPLVNFVAERKADLLAIEQGKNHVLRAAVLDSIGEDEFLGLGVKDRIQIYTELGKDSSNSFKDERLYRGETTENVGMIVAFINKMKEGDVASGGN